MRRGESECGVPITSVRSATWLPRARRALCAALAQSDHTAPSASLGADPTEPRSYPSTHDARREQGRVGSARGQAGEEDEQHHHSGCVGGRSPWSTAAAADASPVHYRMIIGSYVPDPVRWTMMSGRGQGQFFLFGMRAREEEAAFFHQVGWSPTRFQAKVAGDNEMVVAIECYDRRDAGSAALRTTQERVFASR